MKLTQTQVAILCLMVANIIWGASIPIFKWALDEVQPFTFTFFRFFLSALVLLPFVMHRLSIKREDIATIFLLATVGMGFRIAYLISGLSLSPSINAPIIASATPIFLIIGSFFLMHEKLKRKVVNGAFLSLVGVLFLILQPVFENGLDSSWIGNVFFIVAMMLTVFYTLTLKELTPKYNPLTILFWILLFAAVSIFPFASVELVNTDLSTLLQFQALVGIGFAVLFCTCIGYGLHTYGLRYIKASEVGLFSYVDPFIAIIIAQPLLGEEVTKHFFIGAMLVFVGIFIAEGRIHYHPIHLLRRKEEEQPKE